MRVNVKSDYGKLVVELLDLEGEVMPGFGSADCVAISADAVSAPVCWGNGADLEKVFDGRPVRIRFSLNNARLYAYWCA